MGPTCSPTSASSTAAAPNRSPARSSSRATASRPWRAAAASRPIGAEVIDGGGNTLMPGLTEAHAHISFTNCARLKDIGDVPPEEHVLITAENAKLHAGLRLHQHLLAPPAPSCARRS